jgi:hypothetical protein
MGRRVENLEREIREGVEQRAEVLPNAVRGDELLLAYEPIDPAGSPVPNRGIEVMGGQRLEVSLGYV